MWKRWFKLYLIHSEVISLSDSELVLSADRVQEKSSLWPSVSFHIDFKMIVLVYEASRGRSTRLHLTKLSADEAGRLGSARLGSAGDPQSRIKTFGCIQSERS